MIIVYLSMLESDSDREIFSRLYNENKQKLIYIARKLVRNDADAEDAVHNCFLNLAENFDKYHNQPYENLAKLCRTITRNAAIDVVRKYETEGDVLNGTELKEDWLLDSSQDVESMLIAQEDIELMDQALMELEEEERDILYLQYVLGLKPKDIAVLYKVTSAVIRKRTFNCRAKLAKILEDEKYESLR